MHCGLCWRWVAQCVSMCSMHYIFPLVRSHVGPDFIRIGPFLFPGQPNLGLVYTVLASLCWFWFVALDLGFSVPVWVAGRNVSKVTYVCVKRHAKPHFVLLWDVAAVAVVTHCCCWCRCETLLVCETLLLMLMIQVTMWSWRAMTAQYVTSSSCRTHPPGRHWWSAAAPVTVRSAWPTVVLELCSEPCLDIQVSRSLSSVRSVSFVLVHLLDRKRA